MNMHLFYRSEFSLSLNGRDPLQCSDGDDVSLSEFDMVSGDLVYVISDESAPSKPEPASKSPGTGTSAASQHKGEASQEQGMEADTEKAVTAQLSAAPVPACTGSMDAAASTSSSAAVEVEFDADTMDQDEAIKDSEVNRYLREPMLVQDCSEHAVTQTLHSVYDRSMPQSPHEAVCVVLHVLMMETRFQAQVCITGNTKQLLWKLFDSKACHNHENKF